MFADDKFTKVLFLSFVLVALLLASVGIYGVMAFSVALRSQDTAVRMALGAQRSQVVVLVLKEGLLSASPASLVGLMGACLAARAMQSTLYATGQLDISVFLLVLGVLLTATLLACTIPAFVARLRPIHVLRTE